MYRRVYRGVVYKHRGYWSHMKLLTEQLPSGLTVGRLVVRGQLLRATSSGLLVLELAPVKRVLRVFRMSAGDSFTVVAGVGTALGVLVAEEKGWPIVETLYLHMLYSGEVLKTSIPPERLASLLPSKVEKRGENIACFGRGEDEWCITGRRVEARTLRAALEAVKTILRYEMSILG